MSKNSKKQQRALLAIHGFSGHPEELRFLATALAERINADLHLPLLPGHGTSPADLATKRYHDWYQAVTTRYDQLAAEYQEVVVLGNSFGANLALKLATERSVRALIGISIPRTRWYQAWLLRTLIFINRPFRSMWRKPTEGKFATEEIPGYTQRAYPEIPFDSMQELLKFEAREMQPRHLQKVLTPTLLVVPRGDPFVPAEAANYYHTHLGTEDKTVLNWDDHYHLVVQGERKEELSSAIQDWLHKRLDQE